jgi:predicted nucleic acid-binding protein
MKYLLDSNTISDLYDKGSDTRGAILDKLGRLPDDDGVYISILALYEFEYRHANAPDDVKPAIRAQIGMMREDFEVLPLCESAATIYGHLKKSLRISRLIKPENMKKHNVDLMLAATAIVSRATLVSADGVFAELRNLNTSLRTEDWTL